MLGKIQYRAQFLNSKTYEIAIRIIRTMVNYPVSFFNDWFK